MDLEEVNSIDGGDNDGGLQINLYYARVSEILTFPKVPVAPTTFAEKVTVVDDFVFDTGGRFYPLRGTVEKNSLDSNSQGEPGSLSAENPLMITHKKVSPTMIGFLEECKNDDLVLLATTIDGQTRIIGSENLPAMMQEFKVPGGKAVADPRNVEVTFKSVGRTAPWYTGAIAITPAV